jgi:two-component system alkaline phosphatase synthesis response regulator PhoP
MADGRQILLVDDSPVVADAVRDALAPFGYQVTWVQDGADVPDALRRGLPDLILLDVMMPGIDGLQVCRDLRADPDTASLPIIMLTARTAEIDRVVGLELGADDYLGKPFGERELLARVRALLRRVTRTQAATRVLQAGPVIIDLGRHQAAYKDKSLDLTPTEFELLCLLVTHQGQVLDRESLLNHVWGTDWYGSVRVVDTHIQRLRRKLREGGGTDPIETVRGIGYSLIADD